MGLNVADIDRWDSAAINAVSQVSASRADAASRASGTLGGLSAFQNWSGQGSAAALQQTQARAADLTGHVQDASAVATAARTAANEVSQVKSQLAAIRSTAAGYGILIDAASSRVTAPSIGSLPAASRQLVESMVRNTQTAIDKLLQAADKADDLLAKAFEPGKKQKVLKKSKEFDPKNKKERDFGSRKDENKDGKDKGDKSKKWPDVKLYEKEFNSGKASVYSKERKGEHKFDNGTEVKGSLSADVLSAKADANVKATSNGISAGANANATLIGGEAKGSATLGIAEAQGEVRAAVEADAKANASLGADGLNAGAEAFVGGRITGDGNLDVGGVGVGAHGELQAGLGVSGDVDAGFHDGKLKVGGSVGAAVGLGGKVGFDVEIDPGKVTNTIKDGAKKVGKWFGF